MKGRKRESILNTAKQMFIRYGIRKTNLNEIALMARVAKATIYNYFGSKEQVYYEVLNREANELMDKIYDAVAQIKSPLEKLRVFYLTRYAKMAEMSNILNMDREGSEYLKARTYGILDSLFKREVHIVQTILEEGVKQGIFRSDNIKQTARVIGYALKGLEGAFPAARSHEEINADFEGLFNVLCRGILVVKNEG
jgi:AcrR family transcriptional regulator